MAWVGFTVFLSGLILLSLVESADKTKFRKCEQVGFCKRHRQGQERPSYHILPHTVKANSTAILASLKSRANELDLAVINLKDNTVRIFVDESGKRLRNRYIAYDVLNGLPQQKRIHYVEVGKDQASFAASPNHKVVINYDPFWVKVFADDELLIAVNSNGLFKFEHFRHKDEDTAKDGEGFWEETFGSYTDSKPFGSSSVGLDVEFFGFKYLYGLPEHATTFALRSTLANSIDPYRIYNVDIFEYEMDSPMSLYGGTPLVIAHNKKVTVGALWFNVADTWVDIHSSSQDKGVIGNLVDRIGVGENVEHTGAHYMSESGVADLFLFLGPSTKDFYRQHSAITGVAPLPSMTAISYHQCRWNYRDQRDVAEVDFNFDKYGIPYDTIWLDVEHTIGKRYFTWDKNNFPDPADMIQKIEAKGRSVVTIVDSHTKVDPQFSLYKELKDLGLFVKKPGGNVDYEADCWPGLSSYPDMLNPATREFLTDHYRLDRYEASTERLWTWNDMNEPSVFDGVEMTMPRDNLHHGGWENREIHNVYGLYYHNSTYYGHLARSNGRLRPFLLTRAFFAGSQKTAAIWTGDNAAEWSHLKATIPMLLTLSVSGFPFVGADVGGFFGNPTEELLVRWYQAAAFQPFFRAHAHIDSRRREPFLFDVPTRSYIRDAIIRRYQLLPYWYTLFYQHSKTGEPVIRPLWSDFGDDENAFDCEREYLLGDALLVRPVVEEAATSVSVYLPGTRQVWYDWDSSRASLSPGAVYVDTPLDKIPVFQRGGSIVPVRERVRRSSRAMRNDPITLYVAAALDSDTANGTVYLDDEETFAYRSGAFLYRSIVFETNADGTRTLTSKSADPEGTFQPQVRIGKVIVRGIHCTPTEVHVYADDYKPTKLQFEHDPVKRELLIRRPNVSLARDWRIDIHV